MRMNKKTFTCSNGKQIHVFDDLLSIGDRQKYYSFIVNSMFRPFGSDSHRLEQRGDLNLFSGYSFEDFQRMDFLNNPALAEPLALITHGTFFQARVNISTLSDKNHIHIDSHELGGKTLLYYPNLNWELEWGGMTMFTDDSAKEIEHCIAYKPGRVIVFDNDIPHGICAPTNLAPSYRFSFAAQYSA